MNKNTFIKNTMKTKFFFLFFLFFFIFFFPILSYASGGTTDYNIFNKIVTNISHFSSELGIPGFCWSCPIFKKIFLAINILVNHITGNLKEMLIPLTGIILLFLIAFKVLTNVSNVINISGAGFLENLTQTILKFIVIFLLLSSMNTLYQYILEPILRISLSIANRFQELIFGTTLSNTYNISTTSLTTLNEYLRSIGAQELSISSCTNIDCNVPGIILGNHVCTNLIATLCHISSAIIVGFSIGLTFLVAGCNAIENSVNIVLIITGILVCISYISIIIKVPLMLIDPLFKMGFVLAFSPILIVLWFIPSTASYVKNAFFIFLSSCFQFIFVSFLTVFAISMLNFALGVGDQKDVLEKIIRGSDMAIIVSSLKTGFIIVIWAFMASNLASKIMDMSSSLAEFFAGTPGFGHQLASTLVQWTGQAFKKIGYVTRGLK